MLLYRVAQPSREMGVLPLRHCHHRRRHINCCRCVILPLVWPRRPRGSQGTSDTFTVSVVCVSDFLFIAVQASGAFKGCWLTDWCVGRDTMAPRRRRRLAQEIICSPGDDPTPPTVAYPCCRRQSGSSGRAARCCGRDRRHSDHSAVYQQAGAVRGEPQTARRRCNAHTLCTRHCSHIRQ